jgi:leader peptidase (prepilin peptidase) / N-methyltransferase
VFRGLAWGSGDPAQDATLARPSSVAWANGPPASGYDLHMFGFVIALCAVFGLAVGSFLNVVIYRVPRHESIVSPRSACPACGAPIRERDNVPVVSWLVLRGRCRDCYAPFGATAARFGVHWDLPAYLVLFAGLLALSCIDLERMLLPKVITYPLTGAVAALLLVAAALMDQWHGYVVGLACAAAWFAVFYALNFASPQLLGFGDVRLAPVLGISLGWLGVGYALLGFFAANVMGAAVGIALIAAQRKSRGDRVPYGVFLAAGCVVAIFAGPVLLAPFSHRAL